MAYDILIKNALCIDIEQNINKNMDVAVINNRIAKIEPVITEPALQTIDADGCILTPGLIDFHTHVYYGGTDIGIHADSAYLPTGVTSVVDAGSAGSATFESYMNSCVMNSVVRIKSFINVCPTGLGTMKFHENVSSTVFDKIKTKRMLDKYKDNILALKIRASSELVGSAGLEPLRAAAAFAKELNLPLAVHTTNPPSSAGELADILKAGDIYIHCYQGTGNNIIAAGQVSDKILAARERGVIFDAANGGNHWVFDVAETAFKQGFYPDIISTDLTVKTLFKPPVHSLPYIMSKYLNMGMKLADIIKACTATPAKLMHMQNEIGTLKIGAVADITILKLINKPIVFTDTKKEQRTGNRFFENQLTIKDGSVVYRSINF